MTLTLYSSQDFNVRTSKDINLNVTDTVKIWYTSSKGVSGPTGRVDIDNEGFILKWSSLDQPGGGIKRQDIEFNNDLAVQPDYKSYSVDTNTIYPPCLEIKWDDQNFETGSLPEIATSSSLYAIKDLDTNEFVVDFDQEFTKISCDSTSNYFDVYMNGLEPERYYQILIQTTISGSTIVKNDDYYFKVVNG